jgi:hypothetical protein
MTGALVRLKAMKNGPVNRRQSGGLARVRI